MQDKRIAFIGAGNMGEALIKGLLEAGRVRPEQLIATDIRKDRLEAIRKAYRIDTVTDNREAVAKAQILLLAVKPQVMNEVLTELRGAVAEDHCLLSIAAGIPTAFIEARFSQPTRVVRIMPNTPAFVLAGASAIAPGRHATPEDLEIARQILNAVGRVVQVDEKLMDAVTGLSGSGPAYIFVVIEALSDAGVRMGLSREVATLLAAQTVFGAARMVLESGEHPARLRDSVTSPGGTTIAGLHVLEQAGFRGILMTAVEAAARRSQELGKEVRGS
ncbi:MAG: pyrroline-5-carboxylate reductase [candidate division NC10 bacterium]|nr:pyrroline-5-carboxylate reductase [candidate division NC10 bacterium]MCZ6551064.1 pyrroline-5-carboxylate reductase [candidate division NC10 bacterium]